MDYAGNSNKQREEAKQPKAEELPEKRIERVVTGDVVVKKAGLGKKMKGIFFGGEFKSASRYIFADVLLPAARSAVVDAVTKGAERVVWGESGASRHRRPEMRGNVQYFNPGSRTPRSVMLPNQPPYVVQRRRESHEFLIADRAEAEAALEQLIEVVDKYGVVSLADLLEILGQPVAVVDHNWGWTYIKSARIRQVREGSILELPTMEEIRQ